MTKNLIIRASAGTGKTYSIATRYLQLAVVFGVPCCEITALTFSRAAAQEIYAKIVARLVNAAASEEVAAREIAAVTENGAYPLAERFASFAAKSQVFVSLLREIIASQHFGAIATLDSFILRLVSNFPLETGFQGAVSVLDESMAAIAMRRAVLSLAATADGAAAISALVKAANPGENPFDPVELAIKTAEGAWRKFVLDNPASAGLTAASMMENLGIEPPERREDGSLAFLCATPDPAWDALQGNLKKAMAGFSEAIARADGSSFSIKGNVDVCSMVEHFTGQDKAADSWTRDTSSKTIRYDMPHELAEAVRRDLKTLAAAAIQRKLEIAAAKIASVAYCELEYNRAARRMGRLSFDDLARFRERQRGRAAQALANLEYRFDARLSHWALDEFQDTSMQQWASIKDLVEDAAGNDSKSVMAVGDLKQAIYAWRGGSVEPFLELAAMPAMCGKDAAGNEIFTPGANMPIGKIGHLDVSRRYGLKTCEFVNRLFGSEELVCGRFCNGAAAGFLRTHWIERFRRHEAPENAPQDVVRVEEFSVENETPSPQGQDQEDASIIREVRIFGPKVAETLKEMLACGAGEIALLVRRNETGRSLEAFLKKDGTLPVVWEGEGAILDSPVVNRILDVLRLAENPSEKFAAGAVRMAKVFDGTGADARRMLSRLGLARTIRKIAEGVLPGLDELSRRKVSSLLGMAISWQAAARPDSTVADFRDYLASCKERASAGGGAVRIITMHHSKGLTLERVVVPVFESKFTDYTKKSNCVYSGDGWAVEGLDGKTAAISPALQKSWLEKRDNAILETLNLYYVAFTRHVRELRVIINSDAAGKCGTISNMLKNCEIMGL